MGLPTCFCCGRPIEPVYGVSGLCEFCDPPRPISILCAGKHGLNPRVLDCPKCLEEERDRYREALEAILLHEDAYDRGSAFSGHTAREALSGGGVDGEHNEG